MMRRWILLLLAGCCLQGACGQIPGGSAAGLLEAGDGAHSENPPPDGTWRPHLLARCQKHPPPRGAVLEYFDEGRRLFLMHNGGDASVLLELAIAELGGYPWLIVMLAQIYLLAGQGEPHCLPSSGSYAPSGDWQEDRLRLLGRSEDLLRQLGRVWTDDSVVDFLLADAARARDDHAAAAEYDHFGRQKCTHMESLDLLIAMRGLRQRSAELVTLLEPSYPTVAAERRIQGEVCFDVLVDPFGRVSVVKQVGKADPDLARAARQAIVDGGYQTAMVGYYPVWSWLRVPVRFRIGK